MWHALVQRWVQVEFMLRPGSLLLMEGATQEHWQHAVPKQTVSEQRKVGPYDRKQPVKNKQQATLTSLWQDSSGLQADTPRGKLENFPVGRVNLTFRRLRLSDQ